MGLIKISFVYNEDTQKIEKATRERIEADYKEPQEVAQAIKSFLSSNFKT